MKSKRFINKNMINLIDQEKKYDWHVANMENIQNTSGVLINDINQHQNQFNAQESKALQTRIRMIKNEYYIKSQVNKSFVKKLVSISERKIFSTQMNNNSSSMIKPGVGSFEGFNHNWFNSGSNYNCRIQKAKEIQNQNQFMLKRILKHVKRDVSDFKQLMAYKQRILRMKDIRKDSPGPPHNPSSKLLYNSLFKPVPAIITHQSQKSRKQGDAHLLKLVNNNHDATASTNQNQQTLPRDQVIYKWKHSSSPSNALHQQSTSNFFPKIVSNRGAIGGSIYKSLVQSNPSNTDDQSHEISIILQNNQQQTNIISDTISPKNDQKQQQGQTKKSQNKKPHQNKKLQQYQHIKTKQLPQTTQQSQESQGL